MLRLFYSVFVGINIFLLTACSVSSWEAEEYFVEEGPPMGFEGEALGEFPEYTIGGVVFKASLRGSVEGLYEGEGPFSLHLTGWQKTGGSASVFIHSIEIIDSSNKQYVLVASDELPLSLVFKPLSRAENPCEWASWASKNSISSSPKKEESVFLSIDLEVRLKGESTRKVLKYKFLPRVRSGKIQWPTV